MKNLILKLEALGKDVTFEKVDVNAYFTEAQLKELHLNSIELICAHQPGDDDED
ncbi:hypothetical protein ACFODZ_07785 [Marinicella sediminis]|uniref:Uncharacterized protein n=1 Tax=Marinicella sediminis TaxID=1792834 RepID=A0ABV7JD42_9GAMM|nr:hypothetical protein [Marinicella sediminis]